VIKGRSDLFGPVHPDEAALISFITKLLDENLHPADRLVCPLTVGGHVDHRVVRSAVEALPQRSLVLCRLPIYRHGRIRIPVGIVGARGSFRLRHPLI
jgi:hypothetical protein